MIRITAHGAAEEVTGSKHLLETGTERYLIDCGVFQGRRAEAHRKNGVFPFEPRSLTGAVNTHGHLDHCGNYPFLVAKGYSGPILATHATRDLAGLVLEDSARIQAADARFLEKELRRHPDPQRQAFPPLYDSEDVARAMAQYIGIGYRKPFALGPGVSAALYDAGHILGSASVRFEIEHSGGVMAVGFTGDLGRPGMPIIRDPELLPPVDFLVSESTYGDRLHDPMTEAADELAAAVNQTVERGGRIIIPAFAVERTQELIYHLHNLFHAQKIPAIPVYVDSPMAVSATGIFRTHSECYDQETIEQFLDNQESPFAFDTLNYVRRREDSQKLNDKAEPCIIISSSGMCEAGRVLHHLVHGIGNPRNTILIVGFQAANTLGRALVEGRPEVRIFGLPHQVRAEVKALNAFSAHADYQELGAYIERLDRSRLRQLFLVHGEPAAQAHLAAYLTQRIGVKVEVLRAGEPVVLV